MVLNFLERKDRIILTTIEVMNEFGMHSVSTREIAQREGITEAAVFKHFPKKSDLYIAVLDYFAKYDSDIYESVKLRGLSPTEAIMFYQDMYSSYYENYPAITVILHSFDELKYNQELSGKVQEILETRTKFFKEYLAKGQECGEITKDVDVETLTCIFIGTMTATNFVWRARNYSFSLKEKTSQAITALLGKFK